MIAVTVLRVPGYQEWIYQYFFDRIARQIGGNRGVAVGCDKHKWSCDGRKHRGDKPIEIASG